MRGGQGGSASAPERPHPSLSSPPASGGERPPQSLIRVCNGEAAFNQEAPALRKATPCFRTERRGAWLSWEAPCFSTERRGGEAPCPPKWAKRAVARRLAAPAQGGAMFPYGKAGTEAGRFHWDASPRAGGGTREVPDERHPASEGEKKERPPSRNCIQSLPAQVFKL